MRNGASRVTASARLVAEALRQVRLIEPYDAVVFERTQALKIGSNNSIVVAAPSKVVTI
jgi:hypothetical protein